MARPTNEEAPSVAANELARRAVGGCAISAGELADRYRPRLIKALRPYLGGRTIDAEDLAQETLARALGELRRFDPRFQFTTWLYTIAFRLARDHRRKRRWKEEIGLPLEGVIDRGILPGQALETRESVAGVWDLAKSLLREEHFTPLWLRFGENLSVAEVATVLAQSQIAVRVRLHRARKILIRHANLFERGEAP